MTARKYHKFFTLVTFLTSLLLWLLENENKQKENQELMTLEVENKLFFELPLYFWDYLN